MSEICESCEELRETLEKAKRVNLVLAAALLALGMPATTIDLLIINAKDNDLLEIGDERKS